jgi:hypothetical protein
MCARTVEWIKRLARRDILCCGRFRPARQTMIFVHRPDFLHNPGARRLRG